MKRALDAAGIADPQLRSAYETCRRINARHGRSFYLATRLLQPARRPHVHALYGFARCTDDIVDSGAPEPARRFAEWTAAWHEGQSHPLLDALHHTVATTGLDPAHIETFLGAMAMDLVPQEYPTYADLEGYMAGSAAAIGLALLPVLGVLPGAEHAAAPPARALGLAFQLTNFVRDVGEDLRRGRLYLPLEDLDRFGVSRAALAEERPDRRVRELLGFEIDRARRLYQQAEPGIALLVPPSRPCVWAAARLYACILDQVEANGYRVADRRATVPRRTRARIAVAAALKTRRGGPATPTTTR
ncbi:MAG: phytoene/squalene synthase family protein [Mycobacteriales bacterium]